MLDDFFHSVGRKLTRRAMLRGTGVAMALPWLESIPVWVWPRKALRRKMTCKREAAAVWMAETIFPSASPRCSWPVA